MSVEKLKQAHNWFHYEVGFDYVADDMDDHPDRWKICRMNEAYRFFGTSESAALTKINKLVVELGVEPECLSIVRCATEVCPESKPFDHAILRMTIGEDWYFSDNRYPDHPAALNRDLDGYVFYDCVSIENLLGEGTPKRFK